MKPTHTMTFLEYLCHKYDVNPHKKSKEEIIEECLKKAEPENQIVNKTYIGKKDGSMEILSQFHISRGNPKKPNRKNK